MRLTHKLVNVVIVAVLEAVCRLAYRSYASADGNLSAPRGESRSTKRELRFRALLGKHEAEVSLTVVGLTQEPSERWDS